MTVGLVLERTNSQGYYNVADKKLHCGKMRPVIKPHPRTDDPWTVHEQFLREGRRSKKLKKLPLNAPISSDKIRFVCIADTHNQLGNILYSIPNGDVLLHAGDFTVAGDPQKVFEFNFDLGKLPHKHKVVIAGNHEFGFEEDDTGIKLEKTRRSKLTELGVTHPKQLLTNCVYLQDSETTIYGYRIYGSPWHPMEGFPFGLPRGPKLLEKWDKIPEEIDILLTHTPPLMHGDYSHPSKRHPYALCGCVELLNTIEQRVKPKYHVFGHIHPANGLTTNDTTVFANAAICLSYNNPCFEPILFDLPLKEGFQK